MKIVFLLPHAKVSGGVRVILTYADFLSRRGHIVFVIISENSRRNRWWAWLTKKPYWLKLDKNIRFIWASANQISKTIVELKADAVIADSWPMARILFGIKTETLKFEMIQHDERLYHGDANIVSDVYSNNIKKIVVSSWLQEKLLADFNQSSELLLNSFSPQIFRVDRLDKRVDSSVRILVLDHPYKWKGTAEAVDIVLSLKKKYPQVKLIGFGARGHGLVNNYDEYYNNPPQSKLATLYSSCDIYLCASWDEGFGLPSLEAMACGVAVVTYDNGGSRDFAIDGQTALVASRRDKNELSNKLELLIADQGLRAHLVSGANDLIKSWPSWEEQVGKLEQILKNAINGQ